MDNKSKYLIWIFIIITAAAVYWGYRTFIIDRDFIVHNYSECDPTTQSCFMWCEEGECEEDYYSKIAKKASSIPVCNDALEECEPLTCEPNEANCEIIYCSEDTVDEGEICTSPADFQIEEPEPEATSTESEI